MAEKNVLKPSSGSDGMGRVHHTPFQRAETKGQIATQEQLRKAAMESLKKKQEDDEKPE